MKTRKQLIEQVATEHANYLIRMAGSNVWGFEAMQRMVQNIIDWHTKKNTPVEGLMKQIEFYNNSK